jgi:hypothetical protein
MVTDDSLMPLVCRGRDICIHTTSIPSLKPASEIVSGGKEIIAEFRTL